MLGGIVKAITNPVASLIGSGLSFLGGRAQNAASAEAAARQMDFQRDMSDTSYQRQIKDLEAAGINPMLVTKLGGASTPPGAMPSFVNPALAAAQSFSALQSSQAAKQQAETSERLSEPQIRQVEAATAKIIEEIKNIPLEGVRLQETAWMLFNQAKLYQEQGATQQQVRDQLIATVQKLIAETDLIRFDIKAAQLLDNLGREAKQLEPIVNILKMFLGRR